jgi:hypothetical protein
MSNLPAFRRGGQDQIVGKIRLNELNKFYRHRYPDCVFPDDDAGLEDLKILLHHYALTKPMAIPRIIKMWAPWLDDDRTAAVLDEIYTYPRKWRANKLGWLLGFTGKEWRMDNMHLRTITPIDMSATERRYFSEVMRKERRRKKRIMNGGQERAEYEGNSLSRTKPWLAEGISRATWFRRRETSTPAIKLTMLEPYLSHSEGKAWVDEYGSSSTQLPASPDSSAWVLGVAA